MRIDGIDVTRSIPVEPLNFGNSMGTGAIGSGENNGGIGEINDIGNIDSAGNSDPSSMENILTNALDKIQAPQTDFENKLSGYISGNEELHTVMMSAEKAKFSMNFTVKVRDKIIDAYQTIMRMQV
jgi:flagellar hook-basal body complex protein FliE